MMADMLLCVGIFPVISYNKGCIFYFDYFSAIVSHSGNRGVWDWKRIYVLGTYQGVHFVHPRSQSGDFT